MQTADVRFARVLPLLTLLSLLSGPAAPAPDPASASGRLRDGVRAHVTAHESEILGEFRELLAIPNLASDSENIRKNARAIAALFEKRGVRTELLEEPGAPPVVFGDLPAKGAARTVVFYAHYDGQPVDPAQWTGEPWTPVLRDGPLEDGGRDVAWGAIPAALPGEWRLYARSAGDDKAAIVGFLAALDALSALRVSPSVNLKFFLEGEEEAGSPHLEATLRRHASRLKADAWAFCDGPVHTSRRPLVFFGARGVVGLDMTVYGPARPLHSGHYGNWAPNPVALLSGLAASMRAADGRITIPGFSDDVLPPTAVERRALGEVPDDGPALERELGLAPDGARRPLAESVLAPALNFRGFSAGHVGEAAANAIPTEARVSIDFRLVPDQTPERVRERVEDFVTKQGFFIVRGALDRVTRLSHPRILRMDWSAGYPAARVSMDLPFCRAVVAIAERAAAGPIVRQPTLGGSLPMYLFREILGVPIVGVPIANHDDNQHAANENIRLRNLWDGIVLYAGLFAELGRDWR